MTNVRVCQTVTGADTKSLRAGLDAAVDADLVELRLDYAATVDVRALLRGRRLPVIVTCRPVSEGGAFRGAETERLATLQGALGEGAEYVDLEWSADRRSFAGDASRIVLSHHDFTSTPGGLATRVRSMAGEPHGALKVATRVRDLDDCVRLRDAALSAPGVRIAIGMGEAGAISRVCPWLFGSAWTYAGNVAPGQFGMDELVRDYRVRETSPRTRLVVACGPAASLLAVCLNHACRARALDVVVAPAGDACSHAAAAAFGAELLDAPAGIDNRVRAEDIADRWASAVESR